MRKLLEMLLEQLQGMVNHITTQLAELPPELSTEDQRLLEIGRAVVKEAEGSRILHGLYSHDGAGFTAEDYAAMIESLLRWEDAFEHKDRDHVLSVFEVCDNHDITDSDELDEYFETTQDAVVLYKQINDKTDFDASDHDAVVEHLSCTVLDDSTKSDIEDAVSTLREAIRNW